MLKIYHNPRCSKSRAGLNFIIENKIEHTIIEYLKDRLSAEDIKALVRKTRMPVEDLVRTHETYYKSELKGKNISSEEWYHILAEHPNLLHRPIVVKGDNAVFAQPPENINNLL